MSAIKTHKGKSHLFKLEGKWPNLIVGLTLIIWDCEVTAHVCVIMNLSKSDRESYHTLNALKK